MTAKQEAPRPEFSVRPMTNLHALLHAAMYIEGGMPDEAMNALFDAHTFVVNEIIGTPSADRIDLQAKTAALDILIGANEEAGTWKREIKFISQSIAADNARLPAPFLVAAE